MNDIELKNPCPFCGKQLKIIGYEEWPDCGKPTRYYEPECENTDCVVNYLECYHETPEEAAEAWDRRASPWRTDPPPRDGTIIIGEFLDGVIVAAYCYYTDSTWEVDGTSFRYSKDPVRWMEVPE